MGGLVLLLITVFALKNSSSSASTTNPEAELDQAIQQGRPTFVFQHSLDCIPCKEMMNTVAQVYPEFQDSVVLINVDTYQPSNANLILGLIHIETPLWLGGLRERVTLKGAPGALLLGLVSGLVASQCATPAILTYVMAKGALVYGAALLFGRGLPIVLAGAFTSVLKGFQALGRWSEALEKISGVVVIAVGLYFVWIT